MSDQVKTKAQDAVALVDEVNSVVLPDPSPAEDVVSLETASPEMSEEIRARMDEEMAAAEWEGDFASFLDFLRTDPQFYATSREDLRLFGQRAGRAPQAELVGKAGGPLRALCQVHRAL